MPKASTLVDGNDVEWEFIPTKPTSTQRGGFIADAATKDDTIPVKVGTDGKGYVNTTDINTKIDNLIAVLRSKGLID